MNHRAKQSPFREFIEKHSLVIPFVLLGLAVSLAFYLNNRNTESDERLRCEAGIDTRNVDRDQTQRIYSLALGSIPKNTNDLSPKDKRRLTAYIKRVKDFRDESFATIKPSKICKKYVSDDKVTPQQWEKAHPPKALDDEEPGDKK